MRNLSRINRWSTGPPLPHYFDGAAVVQRQDSFVLVGGNTVDVFSTLDTLYEFDRRELEWVRLNSTLEIPRDNHVAIPVSDDQVRVGPCSVMNHQ